MNFYHEDCSFVELSGFEDWAFAGILDHASSFEEKYGHCWSLNTAGWSFVGIFAADHVRRCKISGWPFAEEPNLVDSSCVATSDREGWSCEEVKDLVDWSFGEISGDDHVKRYKISDWSFEEELNLVGSSYVATSDYEGWSFEDVEDMDFGQWGSPLLSHLEVDSVYYLS